MRKIAAFALCFIVLTITAAITAYGISDVYVSINGEPVNFTGQKPVVSNGRTLVPLRGVFEKLGVSVGWDGDSKTVTAVKGDTMVKIAIDDKSFSVNGVEYEMDVPARIMNNSTMVPVRVIAQSFGCIVNWDDSKRQVSIIYNEADSGIENMQYDFQTYYKYVGNVGLPLRVYYPENKEYMHNVVVTIHGGSWYSISNNDKPWDGGTMDYHARYYAKKGYTGAAISYRSIDISQETSVFDQLEDCKDAIRFINEQIGIEKLIVIGDSAGAHLATLLAMSEDIHIDMVIACSPVLDLTGEKWSYVVKDSEEAIRASPIYNPKWVYPKLRFVHGIYDSVASYEDTEKFCQDMKAWGCDVELVTLQTGHSFLIQGEYFSEIDVRGYLSVIDSLIE